MDQKCIELLDIYKESYNYILTYNYITYINKIYKCDNSKIKRHDTKKNKK